MVTGILQEIGKVILNILSDSIDEKQKDNTSDGAVFLFFSFDLANSTSFKAEHPSLWSSVFTCFYSQVLENLGVEDYKTPNNDDESVCVRKLWKLIGDEVLIYVEIKELSQLYTQIASVSKTLDILMKKIADKVEKDICNGECTVNHCQDVRQVVVSTLGVKVAAWLAECHTERVSNASNIIYCPMTTTFSDKRIDFLGKEIDEGFRMAKYAVKNKILVSPLLAWLIWRKSQEDEDEKKIIKANFKITAFVTMKGVWKSRKVPMVMFHQSFERLIEILEYDELDLETYSNVREAGVERFATDRRFEIDRIDKILADVYEKNAAERLYKRLENASDIEIISGNIDKKQEFHVACMIFDEESRILIHEDSERGYEFGCIKKIFGKGIKNWKNICEEGYKEKYNIDIKVEECPIPIATYYYEKSNAVGLIVMADFVGEMNKISERVDWKFCGADELQGISEKSVDSFKENVSRALNLRKREEKDER